MNNKLLNKPINEDIDEYRDYDPSEPMYWHDPEYELTDRSNTETKEKWKAIIKSEDGTTYETESIFEPDTPEEEIKQYFWENSSEGDEIESIEFIEAIDWEIDEDFKWVKNVMDKRTPTFITKSEETLKKFEEDFEEDISKSIFEDLDEEDPNIEVKDNFNEDSYINSKWVDLDDDKSRYEYIKSKSVLDSDGFYTDYTMYKDNITGNFVFIFGDNDVYTPEDENFDYVAETESQANEWFDNYNGFDEDMDEAFNEFANLDKKKEALEVEFNDDFDEKDIVKESIDYDYNFDDLSDEDANFWAREREEAEQRDKEREEYLQFINDEEDKINEAVHTHQSGNYYWTEDGTGEIFQVEEISSGHTLELGQEIIINGMVSYISGFKEKTDSIYLGDKGASLEDSRDYDIGSIFRKVYGENENLNEKLEDEITLEDIELGEPDDWRNYISKRDFIDYIKDKYNVIVTNLRLPAMNPVFEDDYLTLANVKGTKENLTKFLKYMNMNLKEFEDELNESLTVNEYHQIDMTDEWGGTRSCIVKAQTDEEARNKAEEAHPNWKYRATYVASEADIDWAKRHKLYVENIDEAMEPVQLKDENGDVLVDLTGEDGFVGTDLEETKNVESINEATDDEDLRDWKIKDIEFIMKDLAQSSMGIKSVEGSGTKYKVTTDDFGTAEVEFDPEWDEWVYTINGKGPFSHSSYEYIASDIDKVLRTTANESINEDLPYYLDPSHLMELKKAVDDELSDMNFKFNNDKYELELLDKVADNVMFNHDLYDYPELITNMVEKKYKYYADLKKNESLAEDPSDSWEEGKEGWDEESIFTKLKRKYGKKNLKESAMSDLDTEIRDSEGIDKLIYKTEKNVRALEDEEKFLINQAPREIKKGGAFDSQEEIDEALEETRKELSKERAKLRMLRGVK